jgi:hypothetical protein
MQGFKLFIENTEEEKDIKQTISRLPQKHQKLLQGFQVKLTPGNTLKGDNGHIGYIHKNKIVVASPWNYSRSFCFLHEAAHLIWEKLATPEIKKEWSELLSKTKESHIKKQHTRDQSSLKQNDEEIFCMVYASIYAKHAPKTYHNEEWQNFIKEKFN